MKLTMAEQNAEALQQAYNQGYTDAESKSNNRQLDTIANSFDALKLEIRAQGSSNSVRSYDGEGTQRFHEWTADINRLRTQLSADDARTRVLVLQTLTSGAAEFATRIIQENPNITWTELHKKLSDRFNEYSDQQYARMTLKRMVQRKSESIQTYFERLLMAAKNAWLGEDIKDKHIQQEIANIFIDGVKDDTIARKLIRTRPKTMDEALKIASEEVQNHKSFDLRRGGSKRQIEPMEIDAITHKEENRFDEILTNIMGATQSLASIGEQVKNSVSMIQQAPSQDRSFERRPPPQYNSQAFPSNQAGRFNQQYQRRNQAPTTNQERYIAAEFRPQNHAQPQVPAVRITNRQDQNARPSIRCYRCGALGHMSRSCHNQPKNY